MYEQGSHDLRANNERAFQYYYEACNHNIAEAFYRLGNMYKHVRFIANSGKTCEQERGQGAGVFVEGQGLGEEELQQDELV
jgi:TPR repeat protein